MPHGCSRHSDADVVAEIERLVRGMSRPVLVEEDVELFDLSAAEWRLSLQFGKMLFEVWNKSRSIVRRVEGVAYRDEGRLGLHVRKGQGRQTSTIEICDFVAQRPRKVRGHSRTEFRHAFLAMVKREYRDWNFELVSNHSDREHSFSAWYTRGLAHRGTRGWAFLGLDAGECPAAADSILAFALLWLDSLRKRSRFTVPGLKLFVPPGASELNLSRISHLNSRGLQLEILSWQPSQQIPSTVPLAGHRSLNARLIPRVPSMALLQRHVPLLRELLQETFDQVDLVPDSAERCLSIRFAGLELARVRGDLAPQILFGLEGRVRQVEKTGLEKFRQFIASAIRRRRATNSDKGDEFYRLQAERWLESLVVKDISRIDPSLNPECVYSQVPALSDGNRGVIDILGVRADGRLAVVELKLDEQINLPFQALDYWIAVKDLAEQNGFQKFGYFQGFELQARPPVIYLVAPVFRFHSSTRQIIRYFDPSIPIIQVGINDGWRHELKVVYRRELRPVN